MPERKELMFFHDSHGSIHGVSVTHFHCDLDYDSYRLGTPIIMTLSVIKGASHYSLILYGKLGSIRIRHDMQVV